MAGLDRSGLAIKRLPQVTRGLREQAIPIFQPLIEDVNDTVDTSDDSTIGRLIGLVSPPLTDLWESLQEVYSAFDPNVATGIALDNLVMLSGLVRNPAAPASAILLLGGEVGTTIPAGSVVRASDSNENFILEVDTTISSESASGVRVSLGSSAVGSTYSITYNYPDSSLTASYTRTAQDNQATALSRLADAVNTTLTGITAEVDGSTLTVTSDDPLQTGEFTVGGLNIVGALNMAPALSQNVGVVGQDANTITNIATPVLGWNVAYNPFPAVDGREIETDEELRERFRLSKATLATNTEDALYSSVLSLVGVEQVRLYNNDTGEVDDRGLPPHSFMLIVEGGSGVQIAETIWDRKSVGIPSVGNTTIQVRDAQGFLQDVNFSRPNYLPIYVSISLFADDTFPPNGEEMIKQAIVNLSDNYVIGEDVLYSRLYSPINSVPGHYVESLTIGTSPNPTGTSNIQVDFDALATINPENIILDVEYS